MTFSAGFDREGGGKSARDLDGGQFEAGIHGEGTPSIHEIERRKSPRKAYEGTLLIIWHHRPSTPVRLHTVDVSEGGARVRTSCGLMDGMTGTAVELIGRPAEGEVGNRPGEDRVVLERLMIGRSVTVAWNRAVRDENGRLDHFEAGLRFF